jgi:hypothetical protein
MGLSLKKIGESVGTEVVGQAATEEAEPEGEEEA